ncbi:MAG: YfiR family protein [Chitinophagaceae bacterium]
MLACIKLAMIIVLCSFSPGSPDQTPAYQVKAAFLYNFSQFVEWPSNAFSGSNAPFVIGVLGTDPFGAYLEELVAGEKAGSHPIVIRKYSEPNEVQQCHILFINHADAAEFARRFANRSILTVSDAEGFANRGGMIRFYTEKNKTKLQINLATARAANLNISGKLLRVAEIVER